MSFADRDAVASHGSPMRQPQRNPVRLTDTARHDAVACRPRLPAGASSVWLRSVLPLPVAPLCCLLALALLLSACRPPEPAKRPNVLIICIDAFRADHVGAYGSSRHATPQIDALALQAVVFDQAFSVASWTKPSVPSLLTGLYPNEHKVFSSSSEQVDLLPDGVTTLAERLRAVGYRTGAFVENEHLRARFSHLDQGFETYRDGAGTAPLLVSHYLSWLERLPKGPFFAYLHILDPHWPYRPDEPAPGSPWSVAVRSRTEQWGLRSRRWPMLRNAVNRGQLRLGPGDLEALETLYDAEIYATDAVVGRLIELLRARGILDHTILIITADHGEGFLEHGRLDHGYGPYDELLHIPLLIRFPAGRYGGRHIEALVQNVDVAATLADTLKLPAGESMGGISLMGLISGTATSLDRPVLAEERHGHSAVQALRTRTHKYIRWQRQESALDLPCPTEVPRDLKPGLRVQVEGIAVGGSFLGDEVKKIAPGDTDHEITAPIGRIDPSSGILELLGYSVRVASSTRRHDAYGRFTLEDLAPLQWVRAHGIVRHRVLAARKLERLREPSSWEVELEGVVEAMGLDERGTRWLKLCDSRVLLDWNVQWKNFAPARKKLSQEQIDCQRPLPPPEELYDLVADPTEQHNIADEAPEALSRMRKLLADLQARLESAATREPQTRRLDNRTREKLRALGYVN